MTVEESTALLDDGFMLLEKHESMSHARNADDRGTHVVWLPQIRAKYGSRRKWYVLEKSFATIQARDKRLEELLKLPKRILHSYS